MNNKVAVRNRLKKVPKNRTRSIQTEYRGILFDSKTEAKYYQHLLQDKSIKSIALQPIFQIIEPYKVICRRCEGSGKKLNTLTGNFNKCRICHGKGLKTKAGSIYTADFRVTYLDGFREIIDVKGGPAERDFSLRKKLLESKTGQEVIVVRWKNKQWVRE